MSCSLFTANNHREGSDVFRIQLNKHFWQLEQMSFLRSQCLPSTLFASSVTLSEMAISNNHGEGSDGSGYIRVLYTVVSGIVSESCVPRLFPWEFRINNNSCFFLFSVVYLSFEMKTIIYLESSALIIKCFFSLC